MVFQQKVYHVAVLILIYKNIQFHDHLIEGVILIIYGVAFIDISELPIDFINLFKNHSIKFKLDLNKNGYKSNKPQIRQLRDSNGKILNSKFFLIIA